MSKYHEIKVRIDPEKHPRLKDAAEDLAWKMRISLSGLIVRLLQDAVKRGDHA